MKAIKTKHPKSIHYEIASRILCMLVITDQISQNGGKEYYVMQEV